MQDLALNSDFSVTLDDRHDLERVEGREAFEQSVAIRLTDFMHESLPGITQRESAKQKIRLEVSRVARSHEMLDRIDSININKEPEKPNTYLVEVVYVSDEIFSEEFTEG